MRDMHSVFGPEGTLSKGLDGYTYRAAQESMACLVADAFEKEELAIVEAGTGTGKSFAYLVPAMEFAGQRRTKLTDHEKTRTVIATGTLNLMTQLYDKDVRMLELRLGYTTQVAMLCGRGNYLCIRRWREAYGERDHLPASQKKGLEKIGEEITADGATGLRFRMEEKVSDALWSMIRADKDLCPAGACPYIDDCFFYRAKAEAKKADLIITNHSLLFSDAKIKHDAREEKTSGADLVLPAFHHLVIDEAHAIAENAARFYAKSYDPLILEGLLRHLTTGGKGAEALLPPLADFCSRKQLFRTVTTRINELRAVMETANETLLATLGVRPEGPEGEISLSHKSDLSDVVWENLAKVQELLADLAGDLGELVKVVSATKHAEEILAQVDAIAAHIREMAECLNELAAFEDDDAECRIRSLRIRKGQRQNWVVLDLVPFSVGQELREDVYDQMRTIVFTSATLSAGSSGSFSYWMRRVGLMGYEKRPIAGGKPVSFASPFDFQKHMLILTVKGDSAMPSWQAGSHEAYDKMVAHTILSLIKVARGGVLVLLASYSDLYGLLKALAVPVEGKKEAYRVKGTERTLLFQGQEARGRLTQRFIHGKDSVLLGTHSFWEGVDVPGEALSMVIIPRIPFRNVKDPFMAKADELCQKRKREIAADVTKSEAEKRSLIWKESTFTTYQLPYATLMLRQGIGRLIRRTGDKGVVVLLDARLERLSYGKQMEKSFPTRARALPVEAMAAAVDAFYGASS